MLNFFKHTIFKRTKQVAAYIAHIKKKLCVIKLPRGRQCCSSQCRKGFCIGHNYHVVLCDVAAYLALSTLKITLCGSLKKSFFPSVGIVAHCRFDTSKLFGMVVPLCCILRTFATSTFLADSWTPLYGWFGLLWLNSHR